MTMIMMAYEYIYGLIGHHVLKIQQYQVLIFFFFFLKRVSAFDRCT